MLTLLFAAAFPALADEAAAKDCLNTKIWEGYNTGWAVRTETKSTLGQGEHRIYLVTFYAGNEYRILVCGDAEVVNADIVLYDSLGNELLKDSTADREPMITYRASATDTFYIAVHATKLLAADKKAGLATAVTYK